MAELRKGRVTWGGVATDLTGPEIKVGDIAPDSFVVSATDLAPVSGASIASHPRVICSVVSIDTGVCDVEMKRFQEEALRHPGVKIYVVSHDLPFAMKRWCGATGSDKVVTLSDFKERSFGPAYGVFAPGKGLLARAVFVVDKDNRVRHVEYVPEVATEPNYDAAIAVIRSLV